MCSVVVAVSSRRDPACLLRSRITHSLTVLLRAREPHLHGYRNVEPAVVEKRPPRCWVMTTDPSPMEIF